MNTNAIVPPSEISDPFEEYKRATDETLKHVMGKINILEKALSDERKLREKVEEKLTPLVAKEEKQRKC
jgi:hypothetical protein